MMYGGLCSACISIHALLAESDFKFCRKLFALSVFLSTLSLRRATVSLTTSMPDWKNFYPRSPCGERQRLSYHHQATHSISIHALLAESDEHFLILVKHIVIFLSTLSLRRATIIASMELPIIMYFYPRSPCGERPSKKYPPMCTIKHFYPRSPCGERRAPPYNLMIQHKFLSTLSLRRATAKVHKTVGALLRI